MRFRNRRAAKSREVDPLIPIMNLVCMLIPLLIFGAVFVRYKVIDVHTRERDGAVVSQEDAALHLSVFITEQGFRLAVNPVHRQPWMVESRGSADSGPDIPKKEDGYDFLTLERRLRELKQNFSRENHIILGAEDNIAYDVLIKAMDASRGVDGDLFPEVTLTRHLS